MLVGHTITVNQYDASGVEANYTSGVNGYNEHSLDFDTNVWTITRVTTTFGIGSTSTSGSPVTQTWDPVKANVFVANEIVAQTETLKFATDATTASTATANIAYLSGLNLLGAGSGGANQAGGLGTAWQQTTEGTPSAGGVGPAQPSI